MRGVRSIAWRAAQIALIALIAWFAWRTIAPDWPQITNAWRETTVRGVPLILSTMVVLASYAVLIETWRRVVTAWGGSLSFSTAARIWFVSNLGKYIPGKVWAITAMGTMAQRAGVSPVAAVGSSLLVAVVNVLAAVAVILFTASEAIPFSRWAMYAFGLAAVAVAVTPRLLPSIARWVAARFGRDVTWPAIPQQTIVISFLGCGIAWLLYGIAFRLLVSSIGPAGGATSAYVAAFTASYLAGYLALPMPGGIAVREGVLIALLPQLGLATVASATVIAFVSRGWLTLLELVPGLILLALTPKPTSSSAKDA
jgi:hypothetical protein